MNKQKTALVTGGAGFIGSHLCEALLQKGYRVLAVDNFSTSHRNNLSALLKNKNNFRFYKDSILNKKGMSKLIRQADIVFHLAAAVGVKEIMENPLRSMMINIHGTENIFDLAGRYGKNVIFTSSSEVYGQPPQRPIKEGDKRLLGSTFITRWNYATSKALDECMAHAYGIEKKLKVIVVRLFNTVGPRQSGKYGMVVPRFIESALKNKPLRVHGDGSQKRSFNCVFDTVSALIQLSEKRTAYGKVFNVGNDKSPLTIKSLAARIIKQFNSKSKIIFVPYNKVYGDAFEDVYCRIPDISKLKKEIRYRPKYTLEDTLRLIAEDLKKRTVK